jgi:Na+-transporting NADH:ubiquinone oxidoreductase subunit D
VLGRIEAFSMGNRPVPSLVDGLGNGLGYALILFIVGFFRELFGFGKILGYQVLPESLYAAGYENNGLMVLAPGAFIILALIIWLQRTISGYREE